MNFRTQSKELKKKETIHGKNKKKIKIKMNLKYTK